MISRFNFNAVAVKAFLLIISLISLQAQAQDKSIARQWNEILLEAIRNDFARPTVHARNLFHLSAAMYDVWAAYDQTASTYFLGHTQHGFNIDFQDFQMPTDVAASRTEGISYACYRLMTHRFMRSPGWEHVKPLMDNLMDSLEYDITIIDTDYTTGSPAALGNYIAEKIIDYGLQDGSNERQNYANTYYEPINTPLNLQQDFTLEGVSDPNRWQPLQFETFVDQSGNEITGGTPAFLGAEWGNVTPFSLNEADLDIYERDGQSFYVFNDPGNPCYLDDQESGTSEYYKWNFELVAIWSSHLDTSDAVMWDISPGAIGNIQSFPSNFIEYDQFYDLENGGEKGDIGNGYPVNPATGEPYAPQIVPRGDYARVLAEFWADGPDSETPPGHWFTILNYINDHPLSEKKFMGAEPLDDLEWDVKSYFMLGGAMHDVAISAWSIKGYYDFVRPITAIRYMASKGQSSDSNLPNYDPEGIYLRDGFIELVDENDPLAGPNNENVNKIKVLAWRGHDFVSDADTDQAGVGWILAEEWWPYQRPSFVTPPFAGYISGHSTFSRTAAKILTLLTGDEYFPGGMGEFQAKKNEFLVFEEGPSMDITLQWAKYYDASDQCSLSRIWGGIHPPVDDIEGRLIGDKLGIQAFDYASTYFRGEEVLGVDNNKLDLNIYPNPVQINHNLKIVSDSRILNLTLFTLDGSKIWADLIKEGNTIYVNTSDFKSGIYLVKVKTVQGEAVKRVLIGL